MKSQLPTLGVPPAAVARARLKHSWLENEVLNKTAESVVALRSSGGWPELTRFAEDARSALALAGQVEQGFSPAALVDSNAILRSLPSADRDAIRNAVHDAYLRKFDAGGAARRLEAAAHQMIDVLNQFLVEWASIDVAVSEELIHARWNAVLEAARELREALDMLPRGTVLP